MVSIWRGCRTVALFGIVGTAVCVACGSSRTYRIPLEASESLNQVVAIRLSEEVIRRAGYKIGDFELFPVRENDPPESRYFGTGPAQPPHGYIMWRYKPGPSGRGVTVTIEMHERVAVCDLDWWH